jgi:hypothetical protein
MTNKLKNIRELGGEINGEITRRQRDPNHPLSKVGWEEGGKIVDLIMAVLARHIGEQLADDPELPVVPLPPSNGANYSDLAC